MSVFPREFPSAMLRATLALIPLTLVTACGGLPPSTATLSVHDFGPLEAVAPEQADFPLRSVEVVPAPWLASNAMVYRLVHVQPTRRQAFKDNRWAAQPAQLVELVLKRGLHAGESALPAGGCRLRVDLDEFYQRFDSCQASRGSIEARVALLAPRADQPLAVRAFTLDHVAPTPDAAGGVLALRAATLQLDRDIRDWLRGLDGRVGAGVRARCGA